MTSYFIVTFVPVSHGNHTDVLTRLQLDREKKISQTLFFRSEYSRYTSVLRDFRFDRERIVKHAHPVHGQASFFVLAR